MATNKRFRIVLTTGLVLAAIFAWIRMPPSVAAESASPSNPSAPFDGVISKNTDSISMRGAASFATTPLETKPSGATRSSCIKPSRARSSAASGRA